MERKRVLLCNGEVAVRASKRDFLTVSIDEWREPDVEMEESEREWRKDRC